jgi:hypothetical protein
VVCLVSGLDMSSFVLLLLSVSCTFDSRTSHRAWPRHLKKELVQNEAQQKIQSCRKQVFCASGNEGHWSELPCCPRQKRLVCAHSRDARSRRPELINAVYAVYKTVYRVYNSMLFVHRDKMIKKRGKPLPCGSKQHDNTCHHVLTLQLLAEIIRK